MTAKPTADAEYPKLKLTTRITVGVIALSLAVGIVWGLVVTRAQVKSSNHGVPKPRVWVFEAKPVPIHRQWQGYGTVQAMDVANVPAQITTTVLHVPPAIRAGKQVEQGEVLMQLDAADFDQQVKIDEQRAAEFEALLEQLNLEQQRLKTQLELDDADLTLANDEYDRVKRITESGAGNQQGLDRAERSRLAARRAQNASSESLHRIGPRRVALEALRDAQRASLALAKLNVMRCTITSPIEGVLAAVDVDDGEQVQPGTRVARVVNFDQVETSLRLPAASRESVILGDTVIVHSTNENDLTCQAIVSRISPIDDPQTRTVAVFVVIDQHHLAAAFGTLAGVDLLLPGMFVSGTVTSRNPQTRWIVPRRAVRGGRLQVVRDSQLVSYEVTVDFVIEGEQPDFGLRDRQWAVLAEDDLPIHAGDLVLVESSTVLLDGQKVEAVRAEKVSKKSAEATHDTTEAKP